MTSRQRELVQSSWEYVLPLSAVAVEYFYAELFRRDPALRASTGGKLLAQKPLLIPALGIMINALDDPDVLLYALRRLGNRPADEARHVSPHTLREAMLHTLREITGPLFTEEVEDAWAAFFDFLHANLAEPALA